MAKYPPLLSSYTYVNNHAGIRAQNPYNRFLRGYSSVALDCFLVGYIPSSLDTFLVHYR